jgi:hypothetical protein
VGLLKVDAHDRIVHFAGAEQKRGRTNPECGSATGAAPNVIVALERDEAEGAEAFSDELAGLSQLLLKRGPSGTERADVASRPTPYKSSSFRLSALSIIGPTAQAPER